MLMESLTAQTSDPHSQYTLRAYHTHIIEDMAVILIEIGLLLSGSWETREDQSTNFWCISGRDRTDVFGIF